MYTRSYGIGLPSRPVVLPDCGYVTMTVMAEKTVTVFGGTGFLGRRVAREALASGWNVRVAARNAREDLFAGESRRPELLSADIRDPESVAAAVSGAAAVVNAVALYIESRHASFDTIHVVGAEHVARAAKRESAQLVHISGIGIDRRSRSPYVRARAQGEERVRNTHPESAILRPSALFGSGDALLSTMTAMVRWLPVIPLFGTGGSRLQPVAVDDVARAVMAALNRPGARGATYELGGPDVYTYRELLEGIAGRLGRKRWFVPVSFQLWNLMAFMASALPAPPITRDQIELVRRDNVVSGDGTFESLGMDTCSLRNILDAVDPAADRGRH